MQPNGKNVAFAGNKWKYKDQRFAKELESFVEPKPTGCEIEEAVSGNSYYIKDKY